MLHNMCHRSHNYYKNPDNQQQAEKYNVTIKTASNSFHGNKKIIFYFDAHFCLDCFPLFIVTLYLLASW